MLTQSWFWTPDRVDMGSMASRRSRSFWRHVGLLRMELKGKPQAPSRTPWFTVILTAIHSTPPTTRKDVGGRPTWTARPKKAYSLSWLKAFPELFCDTVTSGHRTGFPDSVGGVCWSRKTCLCHLVCYTFWFRLFMYCWLSRKEIRLRLQILFLQTWMHLVGCQEGRPMVDST